MSYTPIVIELCHEIPLVEAGLRQILGASTGFALAPPVAERDPRREAAPPPDLRILDPERALSAEFGPRGAPDRSRVLVVAMDGEALDVRGALEAGVRGVVLVSCGAEEIVRAARAVAAGQRYLCTAATHRLADKLGQPCLTLREGEVLALVLRGQSNKEMARSLAISIGTIKAHMRSLFSKLGARCRTEALWIASERGLLSRAGAADAPPVAPVAPVAPVHTDRPRMTASALARDAAVSTLEARSHIPSHIPSTEETPCPSPPTPALHPA